jgi:phosphoglycerol transferase MdoB-like AlkP superfamily enzyme
MGFGAYARMAGIENLYSRQTYIERRGSDDFDEFWGIWDEEFIDYMGEVLSEQGEPFFSTIFTLSSHHPFVVPERYADSLPEGYTPNHRCVAYVDDALRKFFTKYGSQEWFRNSVFVFVADHVSSEKYAPKTKVSPGDYHTFGFIYAPESTLQGECADVVSQIDIMPTLLGLMGNEQPYFAFGRDIFSEPQRQAMSVNYDNSCFQAITADYMVRFDEQRVIGLFAREDELCEENLVGKVDVTALERELKAMIQSYGERIAAKNYLITEF